MAYRTDKGDTRTSKSAFDLYYESHSFNESAWIRIKQAHGSHDFSSALV
ncbi:hypothetical protein P053_02205 [Brucella abortus 01-4165]|uniref:Adenine glycosylase n=4 Tax=Brucella TaxID=234 RepID=A0AAE9IK84_BRUAO|nr:MULTISPECIES: hypothetical protein [Brucella]ERT85530.1 hypothetical protein P050_00704 [Brucella abortus 90-12178]ERT97759.1 hypothetical protein P038_02714 [Brucella abortus 99-9971-135]ERU00770.1 hypothetical protein P039_02929 [Brucella abortus 07-0994-2411]AIJ52811.1 putative a/G-specific adenine glycosylase [Brucella abortus]AIJ55397.1 putative a/G-specific adenine glycosylase [Brucella abortus]